MTTNTERCGGEVEAYRSPGDVGKVRVSVNAKQDAVQLAVDIYSIWKSNEAQHGGNLHRLMRSVYEAWEVDRLLAALAEERAKWKSLTQANINTMHETAARLRRYGKSYHELDAALKDSCAALDTTP